MPKLIYSIRAAGSPLEIAIQPLTVVRVQEYAWRKGLAIKEVQEQDRRRFLLFTPSDELNGVLDEQLFARLLTPTQQIRGRPAATVSLPRMNAPANAGMPCAARIGSRT